MNTSTRRSAQIYMDTYLHPSLVSPLTNQELDLAHTRYIRMLVDKYRPRTYEYSAYVESSLYKAAYAYYDQLSPTQVLAEYRLHFPELFI